MLWVPCMTVNGATFLLGMDSDSILAQLKREGVLETDAEA